MLFIAPRVYTIEDGDIAIAYDSQTLVSSLENYLYAMVLPKYCNCWRVNLVTLRDVAAQAGVSISTVSRCLRNDRTLSLSSETRDRVFAVARALNYRNMNITAPHLDAMVIHKDSHFLNNIDKTYYYDIRSGIEHRMSIDGDTCRFVRLSQLENEKRPFNSAIIVGNYSPSQMEWMMGLLGEVPIVFVGKVNFMPEGYDSISYDAHGCVMLAMERLRSAGIRTVLFIDGKDVCEIPPFYHKRCAIEYFIAQNPDMQLIGVLECEQFSSEFGYSTMREYLEQGRAVPEGIFVAHDPLAIGVIKALQEKDVPIGSEVSVISINGSDSGEWTNPRLTSINIHARQMGEEAVRMLRQRLEEPSSLTRFTVFKPDLIERDSVRKVSPV